ncbi:MAG: hypothetical protein WA175_10210 [Candidatus Acidiferrales bacterium]
MGNLTKSPVHVILAVLAASTALFAQSGGSSANKPGNDAGVLDARRIVELSVAATERSWHTRDQYAYMEREEDRRLDSSGMVKSDDARVIQITVVNGARFEQLMEHNGQPPSAEEEKVSAEDLDKLKHETAEERSVQADKEEENGAFLRDVLEGFDFQLIGEEMVEGRPAYVLQATPHPGYHAQGKYGKMFSKVAGRLWIDKQDFGWVEVDGQVTQAFSMGLFVARVLQGSHVILEQTCVGDDIWVPKRIEVRASAKILFFKSLDIDRILTYSDYRLAANGPYSVSK